MINGEISSRRQGASWSLKIVRAAIHVDPSYPIYLTTGRVVTSICRAHQTRGESKPLLSDQYPEPRAWKFIPARPNLSASGRAIAESSRRRPHGARDGGADDSPRRGRSYRWAGARSVNRTADRAARFPVQIVRLPHPQAGNRQWADERIIRPATEQGRARVPGEPEIMSNYGFTSSPRCIGCQACVNACAECDASRRVDDPDYVDPAPIPSTPCPMVCMHCEDPTCAQVCPADAEGRGRRRALGLEAALYRVNCVVGCHGIPKVMIKLELMKCDMCRPRPTTNGRCAPAGQSSVAFVPTEKIANAARNQRTFHFGNQRSTSVHDDPRPEQDATMDVADYMWEGNRHEPASAPHCWLDKQKDDSYQSPQLIVLHSRFHILQCNLKHNLSLRLFSFFE